MRGQRINRILSYTLSRIEAYLIVGLVFVAVVVAIIGKWPGWIIVTSIVAGTVLMVLLIVDSLSDPQVERDASIAEVDPGRITDPALRGKVHRALEYVRAAQKLAGGAGGMLDVADDELPELERAVRSIYQVSLRLQEFRNDRLIQRDLANLRQRSAQGNLTNEEQAQLQTLQQLDDLIRNTEQEIDGALADLGRSYAEMQAIKVTPEFRGRAAEVFRELEASTKSLSTLASAYDQVFATRSSQKG